MIDLPRGSGGVFRRNAISRESPVHRRQVGGLEPTVAREHVCGPDVISTATVKGAREGARVEIMSVGCPQTAGRASRSGQVPDYLSPRTRHRYTSDGATHMRGKADATEMRPKAAHIPPRIQTSFLLAVQVVRAPCRNRKGGRRQERADRVSRSRRTDRRMRRAPARGRRRREAARRCRECP